MAVDVKIDGLMIVGVLAAAGVVYAFSQKQKIADAAETVVDSVNPTSDKNLAYRGTNAIGAAISGDEDFSLGSWIYDLTNQNKEFL